MAKKNYNDCVFINCPFDDKYEELFRALIFTISDCGFIPRCTLEEKNSSQVRIEKIYKIVSDCRYSVHDISRTELDSENTLPRFNMPLELGINLGAKKFGSGKQKMKKCLILDNSKYRYQKFISDIAGQDVEPHNNKPKLVVKVVRDWLRRMSNRRNIPDSQFIWEKYNKFGKELPELCIRMKLSINNLIYNDYTNLVVIWLRMNELWDKSMEKLREEFDLPPGFVPL